MAQLIYDYSFFLSGFFLGGAVGFFAAAYLYGCKPIAKPADGGKG